MFIKKMNKIYLWDLLQKKNNNKTALVPNNIKIDSLQYFLRTEFVF